MRTTLTLDPDVAQRLQRKAEREGLTFKEAVNQTLRAGLRAAPVKAPPFRVEAFPLGLRPGIDPNRMNQLVDELEVEAFLENERKRNSAGPDKQPK